MKFENKNKRIIIFNLGENIYGIDIQKVQEIMKVPVVTEIPTEFEYILGVINLRGKVIPVINLRKKIGLEEKDISENTKIIILKEGETTYGLLVDGISEVEKITRDMMETPTNAFSESEREFIDSIVKMKKKILILLNIKRVVQK